MKAMRVLGAVALLASSPAWSIPIGDVGQIDQLIGQTSLSNSSEATELSWVASLLELDVATLNYEKTNVTGANWQAVTGTFPDVWAFALDPLATPDWFLIKTGKIKDQPNTHFLFNNLASLEWAVIRLSALGITQIDNIGKISHVGEVSGPRTQVPEPGSLALFGLGLLGLGLMRRNKA